MFLQNFQASSEFSSLPTLFQDPELVEALNNLDNLIERSKDPFVVQEENMKNGHTSQQWKSSFKTTKKSFENNNTLPNTNGHHALSSGTLSSSSSLSRSRSSNSIEAAALHNGNAIDGISVSFELSVNLFQPR